MSINIAKCPLVCLFQSFLLVSLWRLLSADTHTSPSTLTPYSKSRLSRCRPVAARVPFPRAPRIHQSRASLFSPCSAVVV
ncbi:hypothetical protein EDB80DRAFT_712743 [Ilyonectria destructans]|nr:hypothetical protein EDB80DRAFT_712743 [Ilyonectria destructans]